MMADYENLIEYKPVEQGSWSDFEALFQSASKLRTCWCMAWRMTKEESTDKTPERRKEYMRRRILSGMPVGLLVYCGSQAVGWCSVAPRETYRRLGGDESLENVWSIVCFYIKKEFRGRQIVSGMIAAAKDYAANHGAKHLEAYPVDPGSPSYRFMGYVRTFETAGFQHMQDAGIRRHVMIFKL